MQINTKPIIIESLNMLTRHMPGGIVVGIERISEFCNDRADEHRAHEGVVRLLQYEEETCTKWSTKNG